MRRAGFALLLCLGSVVGPIDAQAVRVRAGRANWSSSGSTVSAPFVVLNPGAVPVRVTSRVTLPADWRPLTSDAPITVDSSGSALVMIGALVPSRTPVGQYVIAVSIQDADNGQPLAGDSVTVTVAPRTAIDVTLVSRPGFVVSGSHYRATFAVRNRGNAPARVAVSVTSSTGSAIISADTLVLAPDESRALTAGVTTSAGLQSAVDDVVEMHARQATADSVVEAVASSRVTVVPEPNREIDRYLRLPTDVRLRAANTGGVSNVEAYGRGRLRDGGVTDVEFLVRSPAGTYAAFGDRDEYRVSLIAPSWRARAGDQIYMLTPLTSEGQQGFGIGADGERGMFSAGGYAQQFRRTFGKPTEVGAFVGARPVASTQVSLNLANRSGGVLDGQVGSGVVSYTRDGFVASGELARSRDPQARAGVARSLRLSGSTAAVSYDAAHVDADTSFAGSQRGARHDYVTANLQPWSVASFTATASSNRSDLSRSVGVPYTERFDAGLLGVTIPYLFTLEGSGVERTTTIAGLARRGHQRGVRARTDQSLGLVLLGLEAEVGRAYSDTIAPRNFTEFSLSARRSFRPAAIGMYAASYSGGSIVKGEEKTITVGGDVTARIGRKTNVSVLAYSTQVRDGIAERYSQMDVRVGRLLPSGATVSLRARLIGGGSLTAAQQNVAYVEYDLPFGLPVAPLRTTGRVYGKVVDAVTGRGVPGALVRLGPQVAITDRQGEVAFGGVPGGEHRVFLSQETSFANAVFVGDPTIVVDSARTAPTTFRLAVARSAEINVTVRRYSTVRTAVAGQPDSLADAGALAGATVVLAGTRDTLYRTTPESGTITFTDIPPGDWTVLIRGDTPAFTRFEPDRLALTLAPGETRAVEFRLVPRRRDVQLIGGSQELRPTAGDARNQASPPPATKTVKPNQQQ